MTIPDPPAYPFMPCPPPPPDPELSLPACTNITHILGSYDKGPARFGWDSKLWDRQYMSEKGLSTIQRDGKKCLSPCSKVLFKVKQSYNEKNKYV